MVTPYDVPTRFALHLDWMYNHLIMKVVHSIRNQYRGINAHLHSYWQSEGGWNGFHSNHIADLLRSLRAQLLPMGYTAELEPSLQIRRLDRPDGEPESDVTIFDLNPNRPGQIIRELGQHVGVLVMPASEILQEAPLSEKSFQAIVIYELVPNLPVRGQPVAWLELLSPSNKGESEDADLYREKRTKIIHSGVVFLEIDYLHETGSTFRRLESYRFRKRQNAQSGGHPYRIVVIDPRPTLQRGTAYIAEFDVDDPIPTVTIPLNAGETLSFDFGVPYRKTYEETLYGLQLVDYSRLPLRLERCSLADQTHIVNRMISVLAAVREGADIETAPIPASLLSLEEALQQLEAITTT